MIHRGRTPDCKIIYKDADTSFTINDGDQDLDSITISLPEPPSYGLIDGYGLPPEEQYFKRLVIPDKLKDIQRDAQNKMRDRQKSNKNFIITFDKMITAFWKAFDEKRDSGYDKVVEFIKEFHWCRKHGYWFFNDGKPTYITGDHFDYLNTWVFIDEKSNDGGYPEYREIDKLVYLFRKYAEETKESVSMDEEGTISVEDIGLRICYGTAEPKSRRCGITTQAIHKGMKVAMTGFGKYFTIISMDGDNAEKHYSKKLVPAFRDYPLWLKPTHGNQIGKSIVFDTSGQSFGRDLLGSVIDYTDSAGERKNDGDKIHYGLVDESGKCFGKWTKCLMYNGTVKDVQDVVDGDVLMGDDGEPRNVITTTVGKGQMYKVIPKKGEPWRCNDSHILTLSVSDTIPSLGLVRSKGCVGDIIDIDIETYLGLNDREKKSLCLYRGSVDYPKQEHDIDPYLLGMWLGDGSKSGPIISNVDNEVLSWLRNYANRNGWCFKDIDDVSHSLTIPNGNGVIEYSNGVEIKKYNSIEAAAKSHGRTISYIKWRNTNKFNPWFKIEKRPKLLVEFLRDINVLNNKHIPDDYLIDSKENRMRLLAGLIDSDGHAFNPPKRGYEITQKRKLLSEQIQKLALSLGFYASLVEKVATMKREDGTVYKCDVYRVSIYGDDVYKIPCEIERKRYAKIEKHKNARNPRKFGFTIEKDKVDDYYGFVIDGNRRFLLADYTVVHNTMSANVLERWNVNKQAMALGARIIGFSIHPTTVEEMDVGGAEYMKLCNQSKFYERGDKGQTTSGLFEVFIPAWKRLEGFVDRFGMPVIDKPTQRQIDLRPDADYARFNIGAKEYLQTKLDALVEKGTPEDLEMHRSTRRKLPMQYSDCWIGSSGDLGFDMDIIDDRLAELRRNSKMRIGRLEWTNGFGSDVRFEDDPDGAFELSMLLPPGVSNQKMRVDIHDMVTGIESEHWAPVNPYRFTGSADPFKSGTSNEAKQMGGHTRQSDGGLAVLWEKDDELDGDKLNMRDWESRRFVCSYRYRPASLEDFQEDSLKMCIYFGALFYPETNVGDMDVYFMKTGYAGYLLYDIDPVSGKRAEKAGFKSYERKKGNLFLETKDYIRYRGHKEEHVSYLQEVKSIQGVEQMNKYDRFTAHGGCLLGSKQNALNRLREQSSRPSDTQVKSIKDFWDANFPS